MNICIVSTYSCTFDQFKELVDESMEEAKAFMSEYELVRVNEHKSIMLVNVHDMEKMQAFMTTPEMQEWDKANNCVDHVYSMERVNLRGFKNPYYLWECANCTSQAHRYQRKWFKCWLLLTSGSDGKGR